MNLGHWVLADGVILPDGFEENPPLGFVYRITDKETGRFYIGQKKILKVEKRPPLKGKVRKRKIVKQSDWRTYNSSSNELKLDIEKKGSEAFLFEILQFVDTKWELSYYELKHQMDNNVLLLYNNYNGIVNVRLRKFDKFCIDK